MGAGVRVRTCVNVLRHIDPLLQPRALMHGPSPRSHETRRVLAAAGIAAAGAGTAGEAAAPALVERGGCKLAFFCYSGACQHPATALRWLQLPEAACLLVHLPAWDRAA